MACMEMEHINEDTIRVMIGTDDLAARGITFLDLLGNHQEIENFFYSILEEVDVTDEFSGSDAVTFQVLPRGNGLELIVSKGAFNEDLSNFIGIREGDTPASFDLFRELEFDDSSHQEVFKIGSFENMIQMANAIFLDQANVDLFKMEDDYYIVVEFDEEVLDNIIDDDCAVLLEYATETPVTSEQLAEYGHLIMEHDAIERTRHYFSA
jgi:adapter protein MecA 1/2